jgi:hypothetical protein
VRAHVRPRKEEQPSLTRKFKSKYQTQHSPHPSAHAKNPPACRQPKSAPPWSEAHHFYEVTHEQFHLPPVGQLSRLHHIQLHAGRPGWRFYHSRNIAPRGQTTIDFSPRHVDFGGTTGIQQKRLQTEKHRCRQSESRARSRRRHALCARSNQWHRLPDTDVSIDA